MIENLRPRVLNKATTPSVIKNTEMLDAVNIVADGVDGSETNTIKKISGNIKTYLLDDYDGFEGHNAIVSAFGDDVVLGHCIDEERQRVFYFAGSPSGNGKVSSVYMLEQFSEDEMHIVLLIRSSQVLDFSSENFVDADIIRVPTSDLEYAPDEDFSGTLDDSVSEGGDFIGGEEAFIEVAACPINSDVLVTPISGQSSSNLSNLLLINSGNGAFVGGSIVFGGGSPGAPVDYTNQGLTISGFNGIESGDTFNILAQSQLEVIISIQWEDAVVQEGVYDLYSQVLDPEGNQIAVCNWTLEIVNPSSVLPQFSLATSFFNGSNFTVGGAAFQNTQDQVLAQLNSNNILNPGDTETVGVSFGITQITTGLGLGEVYPSRSFIFELPIPIQQYFRLEIGPSDSGVSTSVNDFSARMDFPLVDVDGSTPEVGEINLILRTDLSAYPPVGSGVQAIQSVFNVQIKDQPGGVPEAVDFLGPFDFTNGSFQVRVDHRLTEEPAEPTPNIKITSTSVNFVSLESNDGGLGSGSSGTSGNAGLIAVSIENQGDAGGYFVLESADGGGGGLDQFVAASVALEESPDVLGTYKQMISTQAGAENPSAFTSEPLDSYVNYLDAGASINYAVRFNNQGDDFQYTPPENVWDDFILGPYYQMGQIGTSGFVSIGLKQFDNDFSGSGVDVSLLDSLSFNSTALVEYEITNTQQLGLASIRPDLTSILVRSDGNFLQSNNQLLHEHMFDPDGEFGIQTGGDTYLYTQSPITTYTPILNDSIVDDTIEGPQPFSGENDASHILGFMPQGSTFDEDVPFGGGLNLINTNPNSDGLDITFSVFVDTIPPVANRVKSADTDPIGYTGALPTQFQPWATAGGSFHNPQTVPGNPNYQSPVGAQGSLGYMVFWTDPISLSNGFDPAPLASGEYHYVNFNSSFVYAAATSQYQSYLGGFRQASIQVPAGHFVKAAIHPFYTTNSINAFIDNVLLPQNSGMPDFGVSVNGSPNGSPLVTRFTVSVTNATNNQTFNGQIMHGGNLNELQVVADGTIGPAKRIPSSTPAPEESRSSVNSSSRSSVGMSRSSAKEVGSLSYAPSKPTKAKLRSARNKSKKKRK